MVDRTASLVSFSSARLSFNDGNQKHLSNSSSFSARSSLRMGFDSEDPGSTKPARIMYRNYFPGDLPAVKVLLQFSTTLRVLKMEANQNNLRASLSRWKKYKADVQLGDGKIKIELKHKADSKKNIFWFYEVGFIKNLGYRRKGAKDFSVSFVNDPKVLNFVLSSSDDAEKLIMGIFAEVRVHANSFHTILYKLISPVWRKLLQKSINPDPEEDIHDIKLTEQEEQDLLFDDVDMTIAEICLREEVDLWTLCRGSDHPDTCDACERLSVWLKRNMRHQEAEYWRAAANEGRRNYGFRVHSEIGDSVHNMPANASMLDELRNPSGHGHNSNLDHVTFQRELTSKVNMSERVAQLLDRLREEVGDGKNVSIGKESNGAVVATIDLEDML